MIDGEDLDRLQRQLARVAWRLQCCLSIAETGCVVEPSDLRPVARDVRRVLLTLDSAVRVQKRLDAEGPPDATPPPAGTIDLAARRAERLAQRRSERRDTP